MNWLSLAVILFAQWWYSPVWHSGDDAFVLYTVSGQLGIPPSVYWDHQWSWHFLHGYLLAGVYRLLPEINWYAVLLTGTMLLSLRTVIALVWIHIREHRTRLCCLLGFCCLSGYVFSQPGFTQVTLLAGAAAGFGWTFEKRSLWVALLLFFASLIRFHSTFLGFGLVAGPWLLWRLSEKDWKPSATALAVFLLSVSSFVIHQKIAPAAVPGLKELSAQREAYFGYVNRPSRSFQAGDSVWIRPALQQQFTHAFFLDSSWKNGKQIKETGNRLRQTPALLNPADNSGFYFLFRDYRRWLLPAIFFALLLFHRFSASATLPVILTVAGSAVLMVLLFKFGKITLPIWNGMLMAILLSSIRGLIRQGRQFPTVTAILIILASVLVFIDGRRLAHQNTLAFENFRAAYLSLPKRNTIATSNLFPVDDLAVWTHPARYPLAYFFSPFQAPTQQVNHVLAGKTLAEYIQQADSLFIAGPVAPLADDLKRREVRKQPGPFPVHLITRKR